MKRWDQTRNGFTIVELLIVIVVIAILAAISIVAYNGIQNRTHDTAVQNDLANFVKGIELYNAQRGDYPRSTTDLQWLDSNLVSIGITKNSYQFLIENSDGGRHNFLYCYPNTSSDGRYAVLAKSVSGKVFAQGPGLSGEYTGPISGHWAGTCTGAGVPMTANELVWLYYDGEWRSWL